MHDSHFQKITTFSSPHEEMFIVPRMFTNVFMAYLFFRGFRHSHNKMRRYLRAEKFAPQASLLLSAPFVGPFWAHVGSGFGPQSMELRHIRTDSLINGGEENQTLVQDRRYQSALAAKNSVILSEGDSSKNYGADQQRLQISDLHFDKFLTSATFACWKIRFKIEVRTCSQFPAEGLLWIKEVELVDSVDDFKSSCSVRGIRMPDFEVLDAKIASALNRIHPQYPTQKKGQSGGTKSPKRGPFPSWKTDRLLDLRVLPGHWSQRFCRELCRPFCYLSLK